MLSFLLPSLDESGSMDGILHPIALTIIAWSVLIIPWFFGIAEYVLRRKNGESHKPAAYEATIRWLKAAIVMLGAGMLGILLGVGFEPYLGPRSIATIAAYAGMITVYDFLANACAGGILLALDVTGSGFCRGFIKLHNLMTRGKVA